MLFETQNKIKKSGFSLVELIVIVAVLGMLSGIAVPKYLKYLKKAEIGRLKVEISNIKVAYQICIISQDVSNCDSLDKLDIQLESDVSHKISKSKTKFCISLDYKDYKACFDSTARETTFGDKRSKQGLCRNFKCGGSAGESDRSGG